MQNTTQFVSIGLRYMYNVYTEIAINKKKKSILDERNRVYVKVFVFLCGIHSTVLALFSKIITYFPNY